jgi:Dak1 domain
MTRLFNDPAHFTDEAITGFVAANRRWVRPVPGGVARSTRTPPDQVAVVIGGGSGHYPAFAGLVGQGLASAAVMGNVFASPSATQVTGSRPDATPRRWRPARLRQLRGGLPQLLSSRGGASGEGDSLPLCPGHRRHLQRPGRRAAQAQGDRRGTHGVQDRLGCGRRRANLG